MKLRPREIKRLIEDCGATLISAEQTGPHWKVRIRLPNNKEQFVVMSKTASCYRADKNRASHLRRMVRENT
jgi:hypothetical protein